ncbi:c-type cytochrome [Sulfuriflexus sp.]|uniref:c-type cytochrome n=1 Tax=Sulfuriflexus sp. TaxID=2015443 RepID=UPI0028CBC75A|nr:c-type cytochrome [Sulfuriflexus sp.]MDT8403428.1 c-type cytochrome [Sulfuriflexus sp.]
MFTHNDKVKKRNGLAVLVLGVTGLLAGHTATAADARRYVEDNCVSCHAVTKPDFAASGIIERIERKGPLLYYAGDKFNETWLQSWLEKPHRIRPGGSFPPHHTVVTDDGDVIDDNTFHPHPAVPKDIAKVVVDYLMGLHAQDVPSLTQTYQPKQVSAVLGKMNFNKFKGCAACHRDAEDSGGLSGPEMYTAWKRMKPEFIVSYIKDPVAWDPHSMMPNRHLQEADIHKLVDYLKLIGEKTP